jgi:hypothetical protein
MVLLWAGAANAAENVIGINFYSGDDNVMGSETADGLSNWTDVPGTIGTNVVVLGTNETVTCTFSTGGNWWAGNNTTSEERLYHAYLDDGGVGISITLTGLTDWLGALGASTYIVRIYHSSDHTAAQGYSWGPDEITDDSETPVVLQTMTLDVADCWSTATDLRGYIDADPLSEDTIHINPHISTSGGTVRGCVAGIKITAVFGGGYVKCIEPSSGAKNVGTDQDYLVWEVTDPNITNIDLYFGTENDPNLGLPAYKKLSMEPATTTSYALSNLGYALEFNTIYYWRVDAYEPNTLPGGSGTILHPGLTWKFTTKSPLPVIDVQPVSTRVAVGTQNFSAFTITVDSSVPEQYQWYNSTDNVIDESDFALTSPSATTNTLILGAAPSSVSKNHQKYYYCRVSNASTVSGGGTNPDVYSNVVSLVVERKVAEYLFNGNLTDTSGMAFNGTGVGSPTYVTGVGGSGQALSLNGTSQYVEIGNPADPNTFNKCFPRADLLAEGGIGGGLDIGTVMCWIKLNVTDVNEISPILANSNAGWPTTSFYFGMDTDSAATNSNMRTFLLTNSGNTAFWASTKPQWANPYNMGGDGQWHMLVATWNLNTDGTFKQYLDGNLIAQGGSVTTPVFAAWDNLMEIGFDGTNYFGGLIDNLRVYNYEIAAEDIVQEYYAVTNNPGCIYLDFVGSNFNVDNTGTSYCTVDLADFAVLAANWLNDGIYTPAP